ncbi:hypothetical protein HDU97_007734 [Phlyctochytrium planicorne]|nr:hypothetical protein HDU97_007734 [Phlyctochytrium planicorne]
MALASCSGDKSIRIWKQDGLSWGCVDVLDDAHKRTIRSVAFAPNGKMLASTSFDATTAVWEKNGTVFECVATLEGHENEVKSVSWSPSGALLATCSRDKSVWIWEVADDSDFECLSVLQDHTQDVKMVVWHPTEELLASASYDDSIKIWKDDSDDWYCSDTLVGHTSTVWSVDFDASGDRLVSVSDDCSLRIWQRQAPTGNRADPKWPCISHNDNYHSRTIYSVSWSKQHGLIATASGDNTVKVAKLENDAIVETSELKQPHGKNDVNCIAWCPLSSNSDLFATAGDDSIIRIWRIKNRK